MKNKTTLQAALAAAAVLAAAPAVHAQVAGQWMLGVGVTDIAPHVSSGALSAPSSPNTRVDVKSDTQPMLWVTRMLTDHVSVQVPIGFGFKHEITGDGAIAGVGKIGTVRALPVTVFAQYRFFEPTAQIRPYVMAGVTYAHFYGARGSATLNALNPINPPGGTGLSVDSKWGPAVGVGASYAINPRWYIGAQYSKAFIKTTAHLSTGQTISTRLDPDAFRIGVGYRF